MVRSEREDEVVYTAMMISCSLSIAGAMFILISFGLFPELRKVQSRRLLFFLSLCDLLIALAYMLPILGNWCYVQSIVNIFSNQASFFWTDCIAAYVFLSHKYGSHVANRFIPLFHFVCWVYPVISVILVGVNDTWGSDDKRTTASWCWIRSEEIKWYLIAGKGVEWITVVFVTIMYLCVYLDIHSKVTASPGAQVLLHQSAHANWKATEKKLLAIPLVFIFLRVGGTVRTILFFANHPSDNLTLRIVQAIGDSGQGFANGLLFGLFTDKVIRSYKRIGVQILVRLGFYKPERSSWETDLLSSRNYDAIVINPS